MKHACFLCQEREIETGVRSKREREKRERESKRERETQERQHKRDRREESRRHTSFHPPWPLDPRRRVGTVRQPTAFKSATVAHEATILATLLMAATARR
jgi:hypothetical protein